MKTTILMNGTRCKFTRGMCDTPERKAHRTPNNCGLDALLYNRTMAHRIGTAVKCPQGNYLAAHPHTVRHHRSLQLAAEDV